MLRLRLCLALKRTTSCGWICKTNNNQITKRTDAAAENWVKNLISHILGIDLCLGHLIIFRRWIKAVKIVAKVYWWNKKMPTTTLSFTKNIRQRNNFQYQRKRYLLLVSLQLTRKIKRTFLLTLSSVGVNSNWYEP